MLSRSTLLHDALTARGVISVLTVVFLVGCAGTPGPQTTGGTSPPTAATTPAASAKASSTPVTSPSPSAVYRPASAHGPAENVPLPKLPKLAKQKSKEGLIAFAEYWYALLNYGYETGDVEPVKAMSGPNCVACNNSYETISKGNKNDRWLAGGQIEIVGSESTFSETDNKNYQIILQLRVKQLSVYDPAGTLLFRSEPKAQIVQIMEASFSQNTWTVNTLETISQR